MNNFNYQYALVHNFIYESGMNQIEKDLWILIIVVQPLNTASSEFKKINLVTTGRLFELYNLTLKDGKGSNIYKKKLNPHRFKTFNKLSRRGRKRYSNILKILTPSKNSVHKTDLQTPPPPPPPPPRLCFFFYHFLFFFSKLI